MNRKKTLLEKYGIPLNHLDFDYVGKCSDAREMEKILQILRSGEEGYYPDLTRCAEERLQVLKPGSKLFRLEEQLKGRESLAAEEWKPIYDWTNQIKTKDNKLTCLKNKEANDNPELDLPPIRKVGKINEKHKEEGNEPRKADTTSSNAVKSVERIKSTDYNKWDKYDPDVELLKMDLAEERVKEEVERKNRLNLQKSPKIIEMKKNEPDGDGDLIKRFTDVEREKYAEEFRLRGNEYFRAKEYENSIVEYSKSIQMNNATAAPAYNNRAIANIKLQKYSDAIDDCEKCLELEPQNIKAWLRKAEATYHFGRKREAYDIYLQVLDLDQKNAKALEAIEELRAQLGDLPPRNATRLNIQENSGTANKNTEGKIENRKRSTVSSKTTEERPPKPKEYDLANLIVPNRVVKNKLNAAAAALSQSLRKNKPKSSEGVNVPANASATPELKLPMMVNKNEKILIEEI